MSNKEDNKDKVGYKNPPKNHQFKKGKSGNPKGRPPGPSKIRSNGDFNKLWLQEMEKSEKVNIDGKLEEIPYIKILIRDMKAKALKNDGLKKFVFQQTKKASKEEYEDHEELYNLISVLQHRTITASDEDIATSGVSRAKLNEAWISLEQYRKSRYED